MDPSHPAAYTAYPQQAHYAPQQQAQTTDEAFERYQTQVRTIFTMAHECSLRDVGTQLLEISQYLLGNAEGLGENPPPFLNFKSISLIAPQVSPVTMTLCATTAFDSGMSSTEPGSSRSKGSSI